MTRFEHRGNRYIEEPYEVFAPRVLALDTEAAGLRDAGVLGLVDTKRSARVIWAVQTARGLPLKPIVLVEDDQERGRVDEDGHSP